MGASQHSDDLGANGADGAPGNDYDELKSYGSATLHEAQKQTGAMGHDIKPIHPSMRLAGSALTVTARPGDNLIVHYAITKAEPGDVLVIDAQGYVEGGLWGDLLTEAAIQAGVSGVVVDGAIRDSDAICELGFPVFARALSIKGTNKHQPGAIGKDVICGGVLVRQGDIVFGDRDGVVVVRREELPVVLEAARRHHAAEEGIRKALRQGRTTVEIMNLSAQLNKLGLT